MYLIIFGMSVRQEIIVVNLKPVCISSNIMYEYNYFQGRLMLVMMPVSRENLIFWDLYSTKYYRLVSSTDGISTFFSVKVAVTRLIKY